MAQFIIRIQLADVAPDNGIYTTLREKLQIKDIYTSIYHKGNQTWHELPHATYYTHAERYAGLQLAVNKVANDVKQIINASISEYRQDGQALNVTSNVFVVEAREGGLPFYTDSIQVKSPFIQ